MNLEKVHEKETFTVLLKDNAEMESVLQYLLSRGYIQEDDFLYLKRKDKVEDWQTETLLTVDFETTEKIEFSLLPASLPLEQWTLFFEEIAMFSEKVGEGIEHMKSPFEMNEKNSIIEKWKEEITEESGDVPGSESVAILVQMEYEKRRF